MRSRWWIWGLLVVAVGGALGLWWWTRDGEGDDAAAPSVDEAAIVRDKMRARAEGGVDVTPARATGRVTRRDGGAPVAGALVLLSPKGLTDGVASRPGTRAVPLHTRTDDSGRFAFEGVPGGRYTLSASAEGFAPARRRDVVLRSGQETAALDLQLARGGHRVGGTVSDVGGGPIEGALVRATRTDESSPLSFLSHAPSAAMTDAEGHYAIWLPDGQYAIAADHVDYVSASDMLSVDGGPRTKDFTLTPGAVIEGRVLSRVDRSPIEGAHVRWSREGGGRGGGTLPFGGDGFASVVTGSDGGFRITGLSSGVMALSAFAEHAATRQPTTVPLGVAEQVSGVEILVDPAFKISGFVVAKGDETAGLPGVMLGAYSMRPPAFYVAASPSEPDGYFEVLGVQPGTYNIGALGEQALPKLLGETATVSDADVEDVLVVLDPGVHVRGRVEPPVAAMISVEIDGEELGFFNMLSTIGNAFVRGRSGEDGVFDLSPVAPGKLTVVARADDGSVGRTPVDIGADGLDDVVVKLDPRARVAGRVTDANGAPVEGVEVTLRAVDGGVDVISMSMGAGMGDFQAGLATGSTDEDGNYVVRGLAAGEHLVTVSPGTGPALAWAEPADPSEPSAPVSVTIADGESREGFDLRVEARDGTISGVVVDEDGGPVTDAWVRAYREESSSEFMSQMRARFEERAPKAVRSKRRDRKEQEAEREGRDAMREMFAEPPVLADETGRFEVKGLRAGTYTLVAEAPRGEGRGRVTGVAIGGRAEIEVLALGGLRGIVLAGGKPVTSYTIAVHGSGHRQQRVLDDAGRFSVERLDAGTYEVKASADEGVAEAEVTIEQGETAELELRLEGFGTLQGRVVDAATGEGIGGLNVIGDLGDGGAAALDLFTGKGPQTDSDGRFELKKVAPGKGELRFIDPDAGGFDEVALVSYELQGGEDEDLGTITGVKASDIPADERGDLGLVTRVATLADRPLSPDAEELPPDEDEDEGGSDGADATERLWVDAVTIGGAAEAAGIRPGDEVVSVRHVEVASLGAANARRSLTVAHVRAGESVALELRREGSPLRVTLDATARAED